MAISSQKGTPIGLRNGKLVVPDDPVIPFIEGDGTGPDIWKAASRVLEAAVRKSYAGRRRLAWLELLAGEKAYRQTGSWLPDETLEAIEKYHVAIKGPLTTPVGGGIRSLNVTMRQKLDLYACVRPVRHIRGVPSPMREPDKLDVVIFRENTEDVYAGHEWPVGSEEARRLIEFVRATCGAQIREDSGIGLKPMSSFATKRLMRMALNYCLARGRRKLTVMHKGNIMKFTEGAFRQWAYEVAKEEFAAHVAIEVEAGQKAPEGRIAVNDRIADIMFQHLLLRPAEFDVIVTPNLNGDYLSDACAAQVGGLGIAPGANMGDSAAVFEATHGTAPKYAGKDAANPGAMILSGVMMLEHLGWPEAAGTVSRAFEAAVGSGTVTYDLARQMPGVKAAKTSEFADTIIGKMA